MEYFKLDIDDQGFVTLCMDTPDKKVNVLSTPVMLELDGILTKLAS